MEEINLNEYKVIVFENGEFVFKGLKSPDITHGDYLRQYVDKKIEDNKYNNNLLNQIKRVDALDYMVDNIILLTNSQVVLNSGFGFFFVLSKNITKEEIDNLKSYSKVFNEADTLLFERAFIEDNIASDEVIDLDEYTNSLPFDQKIDTVFEIIQSKNVSNNKTK